MSFPPIQAPTVGLALPFPLSRKWVALAQIVRLEGLVNYTKVYFMDGTSLLVALSLKVFMGRIPVGTFVRSHRKHLLNARYIQAISVAQLLVVLTNGERIPIARRRITELRKVYRGIYPPPSNYPPP